MVYVLRCADGVCGIVVGYMAKLDGRYLPTHGALIGKISEIYVAPVLRGQGYAKALLERAEAWFSSNGIGFVQADIVSGNLPSEGLFTTAGFSVQGRTVYKTL